MESSAQFLLTVSGILLLGLVTSTVARRTFLPRVTVLLIFGILIGKDGLDIIPTIFSDRFDLITDITLLMVGFLLGGRLTQDSLRDSKGKVFWIATCAALLTTLAVSLGLLWLGVSAQIAIVLGCIASATAPAAVLDVVSESGKKSKFSELLLAVVAFDDVLALIIFGIGISFVKAMNGHGGDEFFLLVAGREIGGAIVLGVLLGLPAAYLTGRIKVGQPILSEALGLVLLCGGMALWLDVSYLIAAMVMGAVIANLAQHHEYPFHAIENVESPLMVVFFVLAGASLEIGALAELGIIGGVYILCRAIGKTVGARLGGEISGIDPGTKRWMGLALLPQAGVAIGMALAAANQFPEYRQVLLSIVISSTVFFELIGPVFTRLALQRSSYSADDSTR
jgi:Kef-type K+ transport system membrane component KefB